MADEATLEELSRALAGDETALSSLVARLTPVIQARVARALLRRSPSAPGRDVRQEVADLTQEVFLALFTSDGKVLRSWDPQRGLSLLNFVGLVADRQAASILRSGKRSPWTEDPTRIEDLDRPSSTPGPEVRALSKEQLGKLLARLRETVSPLGWHLFELLFMRERSVTDVRRETGMSAEAVYAWRSRLRRLARRLAGELE